MACKRALVVNQQRFASAPSQVLHCRPLRGICLSCAAQSAASLTGALEVEAVRCDSLRSMSCDC